MTRGFVILVARLTLREHNRMVRPIWLPSADVVGAELPLARRPLRCLRCPARGPSELWTLRTGEVFLCLSQAKKQARVVLGDGVHLCRIEARGLQARERIEVSRRK